MLSQKGYILSLLFCVSIIWTSPQLIASHSSLNHDVEKYGLFEVELTTTAYYDNPYVDVKLYVQVSGPGDEQFEIDGYWQGG